MKKLFAGTAAALAAVLLLSCPAGAISARNAVLTDGLTGRVLYERRADEQSLIASTTKIMTGLIVCETCNVLDIVVVPSQAVGVEGSSLYLREGEKITVQELLYGMMLHSGNDAATALAIHCAGSTEAFAERMNTRARQLRLSGTHFVNPHGLDAPQHYSTARDLATLARYAMQNPLFAQTVSTKTTRIGNRTLTNHNRLLWRVEGAEGVKTGYTRAAGRILVSSVRRNGRRLIAVTIDDGNDWADHAALYESGFSRFRMQRVVSRDDMVGTVSVFGGERESVCLTAAEDFDFPLAAGERVSFRFSVKMAFAPVVEGAQAGVVYICVDGRPVGKAALRYAQTVERQPSTEKKSLWRRLFGEKNDGAIAENTFREGRGIAPCGGENDS